MKSLKIGMPFTLEINSKDNEEQEKYKCKLVDHAKGYIYIDYPINVKTDKAAFIMEGTEIQASFITEDQSVYCFKTEVVARKKLNIPVLVLTFPPQKDLIRIQRRKYVRVDASIDVAVQFETQSFTAVTQDISGGGAAILEPFHVQMYKYQRVNLTLVLPMNSGENRYVESEGIVVRIIQQDNGKRNQVSIQFENIFEKQRQLIIRYCFEQQMNMRRKALK
ncbi:c-di-GMP-binding flagellar brake protein YcgR, contains PilZNR and PilZ domains [Halobacillus alkaliphilus]|uniref:C-di-GMP-binding flagellar brake protein YcgR, contains PilZNR and PilZ domains n=1 Tax=Halobacillus alkaliphilus TaxID=396056 RepID=A0A1I2KA56_9BACI|nr:flagellar brake domain-containing protein [Halobacillus alkaliphilus]SFF62117.1 c-di-GMP-binding flagellar brake protein YcgR, contains PilZNR and PilZ domains [Halobacillus alkaliphilus]